VAILSGENRNDPVGPHRIGPDAPDKGLQRRPVDPVLSRKPAPDDQTRSHCGDRHDQQHFGQREPVFVTRPVTG
jgi:hypothetical protein